MKHKPERTFYELTSEMKNLLQQYRKKRDFVPERYLKLKMDLLNSYLEDASLKSMIVAVSGGIDSAVVFALASKMKKKYGYNLVGVTLPSSEGMTHVESSVKKSHKLAEVLGEEIHEFNISEISKTIQTLTSSIGEGDPWAVGQLAAQARTPVLYYITSLLSTADKPGVILGTTNRDEGAYLGYVGKASDGMVDLQIISDLHKSEVEELAKYLKVPSSIIEATPTGDMYDGRSDVEVFGASYDFVELYLNFLNESESRQKELIENLNNESKVKFLEMQDNLEALHSYNAHKYNVGSPAFHLDILPSSVKGGWESECISKINHFALVNKIELNIKPCKKAKTIREEEKLDLALMRFKRLMTIKEIDQVLAEKTEWLHVGSSGRKNSTGNGTFRKTFVDEKMAEVFWGRISSSGVFEDLIIRGVNPDIGNKEIWIPIGVSPVFRLIKYEKNSELIPHFDAPHIESNNQKTLKSLVITLDGRGYTRFLENNENGFEDQPNWEGEVLHVSESQVGGGIVFPHRILHDGFGQKTVMRTDILYRKAGVKW